MAEVRKEFVFTWMIGNFPYCFQKAEESLSSPTFQLYDKSEWSLLLYPRGQSKENEDYIGCYLKLEDKRSESIFLGLTFELVNGKGVALCSKTVDEAEYTARCSVGYPAFELRKNILDSKRNEFLSNNTLTLRCRIWKADGNFPEARQCLTRTHIKTWIFAFLWCVNNFIAFSSACPKTVDVLTPSEPSSKISFNLTKDDGSFDEEVIGIEITIDDNNTKQFLVCEFDLLDRHTKKVTSNRKEIWIDPAVAEKTWKVPSFVSKKMLTKKPTLYLQNGSLNIQCRVIISSGVETMSRMECVHEFEGQNQQNVLNNIYGDVKQEVTSVPNELKQHLLLMYQKGMFCDVTLQTETESFQAHKAILCARSPIFYIMFTGDTKEKMTKNVIIDDLDEDTVRRFLIYIYNETVENLDLESATKLYFAGDKYEVLSLRKTCADFILTNLSENTASEILLLADRHQDKPFKDSVIEFIVDHFEELLELEEWKSFMQNNSDLAAEISQLRLGTRNVQLIKIFFKHFSSYI